MKTEGIKEKAAKGNSKKDDDNDSVSSETNKHKEVQPKVRGKWTPEEFEYMLGLMEAFKAGHLPLQEGTTLRSFLSKMMKCKPKRISKKFEGISYNGRLTYQKSKQPISIEQAMGLRARLSELERRYLAAAAAQEGNPSAEEAASLGQGPFEGGGGDIRQLVSDKAVAGLSGDVLTMDRRSSGIPASLGLGLGSQDQQQGLDLSLFQQQNRNDLGMAEAFLRNRESTLMNQSSLNPSSLLSSGFANNQLGGGNSQLPAGLSMQSMLSDYQNHIRDKEQHQQQQQQLASLQQQHQQHQQHQQQRGSDPTSAIAMQLRERSLANSIAQLSRDASGGLPMPNSSNEYTDSGTLAHHNLDLNRYVLQAPQDDNAYFQQRLLPNMSAAGNVGAPGFGYGMGLMASHASPATATATTVDGRGDSIADYLKRQLQQGKDEGGVRPAKRQR